MVNIPSQPEIITVNSEELQTLIRDLLPSQNGFGSELQATNVITPIIDLTATAEGSTLRSDLQTALAFGSQTSTTITNTTSTLINTAGFYRVFGNFSGNHDDATAQIAQLRLTDGVTNKILLDFGFASTQADATSNNNVFDFVIWLSTGESLVAQTDSTILSLNVTTRQIANSAGEFVNPSGYPL